VPVLDGGHLLFFFIEAVIRRPISLKIKEIALQIGLLLLVMLMIMAFYFDIARIISPG
jgi:regulator of sigma E protease